MLCVAFPDSKFMGPTWGQQDPGGPHVGHVNLAIWVGYEMISHETHTHKGRFIETDKIMRLTTKSCREYELTTTKYNIRRMVCIFFGVYSIMSTFPQP